MTFEVDYAEAIRKAEEVGEKLRKQFERKRAEDDEEVDRSYS